MPREARLTISLLALLLIAATGCTKSSGAASAATPDGMSHADEPEAEEQACSRDVECAVVDDCCGCSRGGLRMAARTDRMEALVERSEDACAERTCSEQPSQHRSCTATAARCLGGRCVPAL